jgi:hypothetical protein
VWAKPDELVQKKYLYRSHRHFAEANDKPEPDGEEQKPGQLLMSDGTAGFFAVCGDHRIALLGAMPWNS